MPALNSVTTPSGVIRPIRLKLECSVNHRLPSGPAVMSRGARTGGDAGAELGDDPERVIRPIRSPPSSVNHRLPSGPAVMPIGSASAVMPALNSVTTRPL